MEGKLRILIVIGHNQNFRVLDLFESMADVCDVTVATFLQNLSKSNYISQISIRTFIEDSHMPSYMRGLEDEIAKTDLVVCAGFSDASVLQTLRACRANQKPFLMFVNDAASMRQMIDRDDALRQDIFDHASCFLTFDDEVLEYFSFLGVESDRILTISPMIAHRRLGYQPQLRKKFRAYIGLDENSTLILCADPLESYSRSTSLLMAMKYLLQKYSEEFESCKIMFTGNGPAKEQIKYLAVDSGIAKHILFISQDTNPFLRDLYSAADLSVSLSARSSSPGVESSSFWIMEGLACGLRPILDQSHPLSRTIDSKFSVTTDDFEALALGIRRAKDGMKNPEYSRRAIADLCRYHFDVSACKEAILQKFERAINTRQSTARQLNRDFADRLRELHELKGQVSDSQVLQDIELALIVWDHHPESKAHLQLLKGQILLKAGDIEGAMNCFELCTAEQSVQREAYLGLGRIACSTSSFDEALSFFRKALAIKPNDPEAMAGIGSIYRKSGMADEAVYWLSRSVSVDVDQTSTFLSLTQACLEAENVGAAIEALEQIQQLSGDRASLVMALGQLYYKQGDFKRGRLMVDQAMEIAGSGSKQLLFAK